VIAGEPVTAPALECAGLNCSARLAHECHKEMYIVKAQEAQAEELFRHKKVPEIGL
jgi:hypothetical protein